MCNQPDRRSGLHDDSGPHQLRGGPRTLSLLRHRQPGSAPLLGEKQPNTIGARDHVRRQQPTGGGDAGRQLVIDGAQVLTFRGIAVKPNWNWDVYTATDLALPDYHQILYTSPKNLIFATDLFSSMSQVGVFYDELEEKTYVKVNGKMGTNYVHPSLFSVGY